MVDIHCAALCRRSGTQSIRVACSVIKQQVRSRLSASLVAACVEEFYLLFERTVGLLILYQVWQSEIAKDKMEVFFCVHASQS